jgi:ABC-2 type transport system permease protein
MSVLGLVAEREVRQRLRGRSFLISTVVIVVAVLAVAVVYRLVSDDGRDAATIGVVGTTPAGFAETVTAAGDVFDVDIEVEPQTDMASAQSDLDDGRLDAVVDGDAGAVLVVDDLSAGVESALQQSWTAASARTSLLDAGLTAAEVDAALTPAPLAVQLAEDAGDEQEPDGLAVLVGMFAAIALFGALQMYGSFILMGVVEEKSTAVIEVLLARVRAPDLLAGKVLGIGIVAMLQFAVLVIASVVSLLISGVTVSADIWATLPWAIVWFLGGFALYALLYAMAGALVSRQEDAQAAAVPVTVILMTGYVAVFIFVGDPRLPVARVMSLLPPFSPLLMPMRIAAGAASALDITVALVLLVASIALMARLAGRIYGQLLLRRGSRVNWLDALRGTRATTPA